MPDSFIANRDSISTARIRFVSSDTVFETSEVNMRNDELTIPPTTGNDPTTFVERDWTKSEQHDTDELAENRTETWEHPPVAFDPWPIFESCHEKVSRALQRHEEHGFLLVAVPSDIERSRIGWIGARHDATSVAIVGRHKMCDLVIPEDISITALRHIAAILDIEEGAESEPDVALRLIDLNTATGFADEFGRILRTAEIRDTAFFRIPGANLFAIRTRPTTELTCSAHELYNSFPGRTPEVETRSHGNVMQRISTTTEAHMSLKQKQDSEFGSYRNQSPPTVIHTRSGVIHTNLVEYGSLLNPDDEYVASMTVRASVGVARIPIGMTALQRGILIGRYDRCDVGVPIDTNNDLSRVHLLIITQRSKVLAIDTGSTNGTRRSSESSNLRVTELHNDDSLVLSNNFEIRWEKNDAIGAVIESRSQDLDCINTNQASCPTKHGTEDFSEPRPQGNEDRISKEILVMTLARVVHAHEEAEMLLGRAGFPRERLPSFSTPLIFWSQVVESACNGVCTDGIGGLVKQAVALYPGNEVFLGAHNGGVE